MLQNLKISIFFYFIISTLSAQVFVASAGSKVDFTSNAPLEVIKASNTKLSGAIDASNKSFAFTIPVSYFEGFNSGQQKSHFNENYMESSKYPNGVFKGKIIESIDFKTNGTFQVRAKGTLTIHGVDVEKIVKATVIVANGTITIKSKFSVPLAEHKITIPKVVFQKIAESIDVNINAVMKAK